RTGRRETRPWRGPSVTCGVADPPSVRIQISFFFQAEDGIRAPLVTGVQTCALPISFYARAHVHVVSSRHEAASVVVLEAASTGRSEERRVGKECGSRWWQ